MSRLDWTKNEVRRRMQRQGTEPVSDGSPLEKPGDLRGRSRSSTLAPQKSARIDRQAPAELRQPTAVPTLEAKAHKSRGPKRTSIKGKRSKAPVAVGPARFVTDPAPKHVAGRVVTPAQNRLAVRLGSVEGQIKSLEGQIKMLRSQLVERQKRAEQLRRQLNQGAVRAQAKRRDR